jgi:hypothetical protein
MTHLRHMFSLPPANFEILRKETLRKLRKQKTRLWAGL